MIKHEAIEFPERMDELTPAEWRHALYLMELLRIRKGTTLTDVRRSLAWFVLTHRGMGRRQTADRLLLADKLADTLTWLFAWDDVTDTVYIPIDTTRQLLPEIMGLRGPADHGADLTFGQFRLAVAAMNDYTRNHRQEALTALCAILYHRRTSRGELGRDLPFDADRMARYMHRAHRIPTSIQWGIYAWFAHFCSYLTEGRFVIDGTEVCFAPLFRATSRPSDDPAEGYGLGLNGILFSVAESGVFGDAARVDRTPLLRVLLKLMGDLEQVEEMKRRMKSEK